MINFLILLASLGFLILVAYRGYSVILFAPVAALGAVLLTDPSLVAPMYSSVFMVRMVDFIRNYFPVFLLGAIFGKVIELSGFSKSIVSSVTGILGKSRAILSIVLVCAILTYGGVSLFVVVFAVYPFASELFRAGNIPKRLIPGAIALGAFTFTMDSLPGTPQIQNIIPTTFFRTDTWAAPWLGSFGALFILVTGFLYLDRVRKNAAAKGEGYGTGHINEPELFDRKKMPDPWIAAVPLIIVPVMNKVFTAVIPLFYGKVHTMTLSGSSSTITTEVQKLVAIWAVEGALLLGILSVLLLAFKPVISRFAEGSKSAVAGALLASLNTASEYGFGAVIAMLPGFFVMTEGLKHISNPLVNEAVSVTALSGITGSASGGMSIALASLSDTFIANAGSAGISMEVLHRVASMASGGMDTLPHNGAVITLLAVTGLTHRQSYRDIFAVTIIKTVAVFVVIGIYYLTGIV
jgi:H+/gluconate symporter-like permease